MHCWVRFHVCCFDSKSGRFCCRKSNLLRPQQMFAVLNERPDRYSCRARPDWCDSKHQTYLLLHRSGRSFIASRPVRQQTSNCKFLHYDRPICCLLKFIATLLARNPSSTANICCGRSKLLFRQQNRPDLLSKQQTANRIQQCIWASSNAFGPPAMRLGLKQCV
jgi:hypothetical protein